MKDDIDSILNEAKSLATKYKQLTGKPLGITGEVAEFTAAQLLGLRLEDARSAGFDAISEDGRKIQIKGRCLSLNSKPGQRLGSIRLDHEWDSVLLVLLDEDYEPTEMWEAHRKAIKKALLAPGSKARNERGSLAISKFKSLGTQVWP